MGASELPAILGRNHSAAIVYAPLYQRIAGVKIVLGLHVDDEGKKSCVWRIHERDMEVQ